MTKDTEEFTQFTESVACREYTLPRGAKSSEPKGWDSRVHQSWARVRSHNQLPACKYGVDIRIEFVLKDNSHSWVRISHRLVTDLNNNKEDDNNEQEVSEMQFEDIVLTNVFAFASRSQS